MAGASAATGSGTLATAATTTYAAATTVATADVVAFKVVSDKLSALRQINLAPSSPAPSVPALESSSRSSDLSLGNGNYWVDGDLQVSGELSLEKSNMHVFGNVEFENGGVVTLNQSALKVSESIIGNSGRSGSMLGGLDFSLINSTLDVGKDVIGRFRMPLHDPLP